MIREQKKSDLPTRRIAQRSLDRAEFGTISIAQVESEVDYPIPPARKHNKGKARTIKALTFLRNAILITSFICWIGVAGKSDLDPGYPVRDVLLNTLLCICVGVFGLILHRIRNIILEEL